MEQQIATIFGTYDTNNDGILDKAESQKLFTEYIQKDEKLKSKVADFETFFKDIDTDGDSMISKEELTAYLDKLSQWFAYYS